MASYSATRATIPSTGNLETSTTKKLDTTPTIKPKELKLALPPERIGDTAIKPPEPLSAPSAPSDLEDTMKRQHAETMDLAKKTNQDASIRLPTVPEGTALNKQIAPDAADILSDTKDKTKPINFKTAVPQIKAVPRIKAASMYKEMFKKAMAECLAEAVKKKSPIRSTKAGSMDRRYVKKSIRRLLERTT